MAEPALLKELPRQRGNLRLLRVFDRTTYLSAIGGAVALVGILILLLAVMAKGAAPAWQTFGFGFLTETHWQVSPRSLYTTKEGDTPEIIAREQHVDLDKFMEMNDSDVTDPKGPIDAGTRLVLPEPPKFGALAYAAGTLVTATLGLGISLPISLGCAIFLTKLGPRNRIRDPRLRTILRHVSAGMISLMLSSFAMSILSGLEVGDALRYVLFPGFLAAFFFVGWKVFDRFLLVVGFMIELLAAIPSIAYGLWGVAVLVPFSKAFLQPFISGSADINYLGGFLPHWYLGLNMSHWPLIGQFFLDSQYGYNMFTAGLILSIMITPIMTAIIRDVLAVAPPELEQGALGLGATWWQATRLVLGYSRLGILGAVILGFARAIGETMAVTLIIGDQVSYYADGPMKGHIDHSIFAPADSIASKLAVQFLNADPVHEVPAMVLMAFVLLVITTSINGVARVMIVRVAAKGGKR